MFANNPALCAYIEACKFPSQPAATDIMILSLGTGSNGKTYPYASSSKWEKSVGLFQLLIFMVQQFSNR